MKVQHRRSTRKGGFSLAELMVVIVIIGLLATLVMKNVVKYLADANATKALTDIGVLMSSCDEYAIDHAGRYPESLEELVTPNERGYRFLKQDTVPTDPWGNEYVYEPPHSGEMLPVIYSTGRDGALGGEGDDADITSKTLFSKKG